jgi:hypothetical protein
MVHKCVSVVKGNIGNDIPIYTHLKAGKCGGIVIRTIEECPSDYIHLFWRYWKGVTIFGMRIRKVSHGREFGETWIIRLGTRDVSVYTRCYIWSIRDPWYICDFVYISSIWTTVDKDGSYMPTWKKWSQLMLNYILRSLAFWELKWWTLDVWENEAGPNLWLVDYVPNILWSQLPTSLPTWFAPCLVNALVIVVFCSKKGRVGGLKYQPLGTTLRPRIDSSSKY